MRVDWPLEIAGTGVGIPSRVVTNAHFTGYLETSESWIVERTGIRERRWVSDGESSLELAVNASRQALAGAGASAAEIDLLVVGTVTPEFPIPALACSVQRDIGASLCPAFDLGASCSGFIFGTVTAAQFLLSGTARQALVVGVDTLSRVVDPEDRTTCILFGDGAGASVLRRSSDPARRILAIRTYSDGRGQRLIFVPAGGSREPASTRSVNERLHYVRMAGREVYRFAVSQMVQLITDTLADAGLSVRDLDLLVPHQSNARIIESACEKLALPLSKVVMNIDRYGNTSSASVPIALHEARLAGRVRPGAHVLMCAFGAGLAWGSILLRV